MLELTELIEFWNKYEASNERSSIHRSDGKFELEFKDRIIFDRISSYEEEMKKILELEDWDRKFHANIPPGPYIGDLKNAKLFFLLINPGFGHMSYYEAQNQEIQKEIYNTLYQRSLDVDFPFFLLNPKFMWTSGGQYWHRKFQRLIREVSKEIGKTYIDTLKIFAKNTATLELIPYPSKNIGHISKKMLSVLNSTQYTLRFVKKLVEQQDVLIVVMRQANNWQLESEDKSRMKAKIIQFGPKQSQSASLNPEKGVGKEVKNEVIRMIKNKIITI